VPWDVKIAYATSFVFQEQVKPVKKDWRAHIVNSVAEAIEEVRQLGPYGTWLFTLDIECFTSSRTTDLDNLPKPIVDTLFRPGEPNDNRKHLRAVTGVIFPEADDVQVMQLNLRKTLIDQGEEGVVIQVCWSEPAPHGEPAV
jgi:hypothetical protein